MAQTQENYQLYKRYVKNIALVYQRRKDIRAYIELLLSVSVVIIFSIFAIRPTILTIIELNQEIEEKQIVVDTLNAKIRDLDTAQTLYNQNRRTVALADSAVPNGPLPDIYARQVEGVAKKNNVDIIGMLTSRAQITPSAEASGLISENLEFSIDISGEFSDIKNFLIDFNNMRRPLFADSQTLRLRDEDGNSIIILSITGRVPYIPEI